LLMPLLCEMHDAADGTGLVCRGIASQRAMARGLRTWLRKADVTRTALLTSTSVSLAIRWHDLRATCGTWMAVAGCAAHEIRDVLGHTRTAMTDRYMRAAASVRGGQFGAPFPALPALPSKRHSIVSDGIGSRHLPISDEFLRGGRDSNASAETAQSNGNSSTSEVGSSNAPSRTGAKRSDSRHLAPVSRPFEQRVAEIEAAIASVTRVLGRAPDDAVPMLVAERAAMRAELRALRERDAGNIVPLDREHR
jgi:hypothetical protein